MELRQFLTIARRWLWLIALTVVVAAGSSYLASQRATPLYRTSTTLMLGRVIESSDPTQFDLGAGQTLAEMYAQMAKREPVLQGVVDSLGLDVNWRAIAGQVSVRAVPRSLFIEVTVVDTNPVRAKALADGIAQQLVLLGPAGTSGVDRQERDFAQAKLDELKGKMVDTQEEIASLQEEVDAAVSARRIQELRGQIAVLESKVTDWEGTYSRLLLFLQGGEINVLSVLEEAPVPTTPISPDIQRNVLVSSAGGLVLAVAAALLIEYLDDTIKSPDDIARATDLATLGGIARIGGEGYPEKLVAALRPLSPIVEAYRALRTNLQFSSVDTPTKTLLVTSPSPTEGKSVTLANLAVVMAQSGLKVVAVDSDLRRPVLHKIFELPNNHGLTDAIVQPNPGLAENLQPSKVENLSVLTSGKLPPNPAELLGSQRMESLIGELEGVADVVLFDSPPSLVVTDAAILGTKIDGTLVVYDAGRTRRSEAARAVQELRHVGTNLLGAVLNRLSGRRGGYYYYYRYYYYETEDGGRKRHRRRRDRAGLLGRLFGRSREPVAAAAVEVETRESARVEALVEEGHAARRWMPAWGWVLLGIAALLVLAGVVGYWASASGALPWFLDPWGVTQAAYYLGIGAVELLAGLLLALVIRRARGREATAERGPEAPSGGAAGSTAEEEHAARRWMPAWGWVLLGVAALLVVAGIVGYWASASGTLPWFLDPWGVTQAAYYLGIGAVVLLTGLLLALVIRTPRGREATAERMAEALSGGAAGSTAEEEAGAVISAAAEETE